MCVCDMLGVALFWLTSFFAEKGFAFGNYFLVISPFSFFFLAKLGGGSVPSCSPFCI